MTPLYLYILLGSLSFPLLFSLLFKDVIQYWKNFSMATLGMAVLFLIWDALFTKAGVWGFEDAYCLGIYILKMPIEEWLFFLIIPFCSLFIHFALFYGLPNLKLQKNISKALSLTLVSISLLLVATQYSKAYTAVNFGLLAFVIITGELYHKVLLQQFYLSFLIILIPFLIVNGTLTGAFTETPVVWYDNTENLGIRVGTIPVEDFGYAFSMLFGNLMIFESLKVKTIKKHTIATQLK